MKPRDPEIQPSPMAQAQADTTKVLMGRYFHTETPSAETETKVGYEQLRDGLEQALDLLVEQGRITPSQRTLLRENELGRIQEDMFGIKLSNDPHEYQDLTEKRIFIKPADIESISEILFAGIYATRHDVKLPESPAEDNGEALQLLAQAYEERFGTINSGGEEQ
jgi:hypothetical protein